MLKQNKWKLLISSLIILLPLLFGLIVWNDLPEQMAIHWGVNGTPDGFASKALSVLLLPLLLLAMHWLCILITAADNKHRDQSKKVFSMVLWILPVLSVYTNGIVYAAAFGMEIDVPLVICLLCGLGLIVIGNYLPKCKQNRTIGIKIPWTLSSEQNWNATHRFGGKVWVICGLCCLPASFLPTPMLAGFMVVLLLATVLIPCIYSFVYHKKYPQGEENERNSNRQAD